MKIRIDLKDPDGVFESVRDAVVESLKGVSGLTDAERLKLIDDRSEDIDLAPWVKYREYVSVEIDTDAGTAVVLRQS